MNYFTLRQQYSTIGIALCLLTIFFVRNPSQTGFFDHALLSGSTMEKIPPCTVEIVGDVRDPGIYSFVHRVSVSKVIEAAGGLTGNLIVPYGFTSEVVPNGGKITVDREPARCTVSLMDPAKRVLFFVPFNINTAGVDELVFLPGLGDTTARAILTYREHNGTFSRLDTLMNVPGIGQHTFNKIKDYLTL